MMGKSESIYTTCTRDCPNTCGLVAVVENGRLVRLTGSPHHPLTRGKSCLKASLYVDRVYSPERIVNPMIRKSNRGGSWERTTWEHVLDVIADRMLRIRDEDGPEAILYYQGYGERTALKLLNRYFFNLFGGVTTLRGSLCGGTGQASQNLDVGERVSHDPLDHYNSRSMVLWGRNPVSTNISLVPICQEIRKRGGTVILVDPYRSRSSALADRHIAPKPGRDVFLALAAARLVYSKGAEDREFLERCCTGALEFRKLVESFVFADLCALAGVSRDDVEFLAGVLMEQKPTATLLGWGMHRHVNAHNSIRAIDALGAVCGNIGVPGGGVSQGFEEYGPYDPQYWGDHLCPPRRTLLMPCVGDEILKAVDPRIRMIFTTASNPVCMAPNSARTSMAFRSTELVVYSGHFLDDTADHAHIFLPAATFLEERDVMASYGHNYVGPVNQAIEPVGECRSEFHMFHDLAARFPFADHFRRSADDWLYDLCAPIRRQGCSMEQLRNGPFRLDAPMVPYSDRRFSTPSGRFELMTSLDPAELNEDDPAYPYTLLTVAPHRHICSERTLSDHEPLPIVRMHPEEAALRSLEDGSTVIVENPMGRIKAVLQTDRGVRRDCVVGERGGWIKAGHGLNLLTADRASKVGAGTPYYETAVAVSACGEEPNESV